MEHTNYVLNNNKANNIRNSILNREIYNSIKYFLSFIDLLNLSVIKKKVTKYYVKRDPDTNPIYHMFDMNPYEAEVEPDGYLDCCVTYAPAIPQQRDLDNFEIVDNKNNVYMICTKGECTGKIIKKRATIISNAILLS